MGWVDGGPGFVEQVDRLVRQEAVRDIAVRVVHGELDRVVRVAYRVEFFVPLLDAIDDLDGFFLVRRRNFYRLEAPLQGTVFFDGLAALARRGCATALDLATREGWLENVGSIERAFGRSGAHQTGQFIDNDHDVLAFH